MAGVENHSTRSGASGTDAFSGTYHLAPDGTASLADLAVLSAYSQSNSVGDQGLVTVTPLDPDGTHGGVDIFNTGQSSNSAYTLTLQGAGAGLTVLLDGGGSSGFVQSDQGNESFQDQGSDGLGLLQNVGFGNLGGMASGLVAQLARAQANQEDATGADTFDWGMSGSASYTVHEEVDGSSAGGTTVNAQGIPDWDTWSLASFNLGSSGQRDFNASSSGTANLTETGKTANDHASETYSRYTRRSASMKIQGLGGTAYFFLSPANGAERSRGPRSSSAYAAAG